MQRFNKQLIAGLMVCAAAASPASASNVEDWGRESTQSLADMYVEFGKRSYEAGFHADAIHDFRNALKLRPDHPVALKYLKLLGEEVPEPKTPARPAPPTDTAPPRKAAASAPPVDRRARDAAMEQALSQASQSARPVAPRAPEPAESQPLALSKEDALWPEADEPLAPEPVQPRPIEPPVTVPVTSPPMPSAPVAVDPEPAEPTGTVQVVVDGSPAQLREPVLVEQGVPLVPLRELAEQLGYVVTPLPDGSLDVTSPEGQRRTITPSVADPRMLVSAEELEEAMGFSRVRYDDALRAVIVETVPSEGFQTFTVQKTEEQLQAQAAKKAKADQVAKGTLAVAEGVPNSARPTVDVNTTVTYSYDDPHALPPARVLSASSQGRVGKFSVAFETLRKELSGSFDHDYTYLNMSRPDLFIGLFDQRADLYPLRTQFEEFNGIQVRKSWFPEAGGAATRDSFRPLEPRAGSRLATSVAWGETETTVGGQGGSVKYLGTLAEVRQEMSVTDWLKVNGALIRTENEADLPSRSGKSQFPRDNLISFGQAAMVLPQDLTMSWQVGRADYAPDEHPDEHAGDWDVRTALAWDRERYRLRLVHEFVGDEYVSLGDPNNYQDYQGTQLLGTYRFTDKWTMSGNISRFRNNVDRHPDIPTSENQIVSLTTGYRLSKDQSVHFSTTHTLGDPSGPTEASSTDGTLYAVDYSRRFLGDTRLLTSYQYSRSEATTASDTITHGVGLSLFKSMGPGRSWYLSQRIRRAGRETEDDSVNSTTTFNINYRLRPGLTTYVNSSYLRDVVNGSAGRDAVSAGAGFRYELTPDTMVGAEYEVGPYDVDVEKDRWPKQWSIMFVLRQRFGVASAPNFGRIEGLVFYDENGNGAFDPGEPGVDEALATLAGGDRRVLTDANGRFVFSRMPPGEEQVRVDVANIDPNWLLASPQQTVGVKRRRTSQVWFPLMKAVSIGGTVFIDGNGDGKFQDTEEPLEGVSVLLLPANDFRRTGDDGRYDFEFLPAGDYKAQLYLPDLPKGYELTSPGTIDVGLRGGDARTDVDFAVEFTSPVQQFE